ncbi:MAG: TonB-dependent receptor [Chitinophagaceae bacterium]|nr:MAG: TonB-dependent receptor [Chitinophagaceae bacterium]
MNKPLLLLLAMFLCNTLIAQDKKPATISGKFEDVYLVDFVSSIEKSTGRTIYFDSPALDSLHISVSGENEAIESFLRRGLRSAGLSAGFAPSGKIYITKGITINTELPMSLFVADTAATGNTVSDSTIEFALDKRKYTPAQENKLYEIGVRTNNPQGIAIINGTIRNAKTGEPVINASVFIDTRYSTQTDGYGKYSLSVPAGKYTLSVLAIGMKDTRLQVAVYSAAAFDVAIQETVTTLKNVTVNSRKTGNVSRVQMGVERLSIESIRRIPSLFGEADILRVITSLPGVKTVGEASTGFNVRGGSADQNLILFNDATIYNPSHFFGMFSAFNPELVKDIELYKASIPAKFGGRLASVLDINSREGNKKKITGSAGIGAITTRINLEGPIGKNEKTSFILGGRTTYANWLLNLLPDEYEDSRADFQDFNLGISHQIDSSNTIHFSGYYSHDGFALNSDTSYAYNNMNFTLKWKHTFNNRLSAAFTAGHDAYDYKVNSKSNPVNAFDLRFGIKQLFAKADFVYFRNQQHGFDFGASVLKYKLDPGSFKPVGPESQVTPDVVEDEQAIESALYFTHRYNPNNRISLSTGIRYSLFGYLGPQQVSEYPDNAPVTDANRIADVLYGKGKLINTYGGPEIRFSARYAFDASFSVKAGFNSQRQYIHMLSNTTSIAPTDIWKLSDPNIKPQLGEQVSLGLYKNIKDNTIETSVEVYYKRIRNYLDYKPGADLLLNHNIETDVIATRGKAYGVELLLKKTAGKVNGWISYTYSRILLRSNDPNVALRVNNGDYYPANYDKPHDVTFTGNFRVNHRFSLSLNSTYSTGRPITIPVGRYYYAGAQRVLFSERNSYRIPDYFRTDFSMNIDGNHKVNQKTHNSWTIGAYNLFGRRNPYSVYFVSENGNIKGYKMSIFGSIIPFINYNIRF